MGKDSKIEWTHHTYNCWIGCSKVNRGCANCYAERQDRYRGWTPDGWGPGKPRYRTSETYRKQPFKWFREAVAAKERHHVFCGSLMDVFDAEAPQEWRDDLWDMLGQLAVLEDMYDGACGLDWMLLTKRPENVEDMLPLHRWLLDKNMPHNLWFGYSACDQDTLDESAPVMESFAWTWRPRVLFLSLEPILGPVDLEMWLEDDPIGWCDPETGDYERGNRGLNLVIIGCESGPNRRPMELDWARDLVSQCKEAGVACFVKQLPINGRVSHDPAEWPEDLRIREFPT